jgi:hypothetical protein
MGGLWLALAVELLNAIAVVTLFHFPEKSALNTFPILLTSSLR